MWHCSRVSFSSLSVYLSISVSHFLRKNPNWVAAKFPQNQNNTLRRKEKMQNGDGSSNGRISAGEGRQLLSEVVADCVRRWFQDTLKEAKSGDVNMQVLVSQMYYSGYGVPKDAQKGRLWMTRASRVRSSVWRVSEKRPGYNASDSDSDELIGGN